MANYIYKIGLKLFIYITFIKVKFSHGFYVPGVSPQSFKEGDDVPIKAIKMTSSVTQLPYDYYSLPFCKPDELLYEPENIGQVLRGDRIVNTPYKVSMLKNKDCTLTCKSYSSPIVIQQKTAQQIALRIRNEYYVHLSADNLPCATTYIRQDTGEKEINRGFKLGYENNGKFYINNHLKFIFSYNKEDGANRIVGFEVEPKSINFNDLKESDSNCIIPEMHNPQAISTDDSETKLLFTYSTEWRESDVKWTSRWDIYLKISDIQIHWFSIINSIIVLFFLSGILIMIMIRTLRRDIAKYNAEETLEDTLEESGWKLIHGDVFRPPRFPKLYSAIIGSGVQMSFMFFIILIFAMLGMLSPASKGALMTAGIFLYVLMSLVAGYMSGRLYKTLRGHQWKSAAFWTASLFPFFIFSVGLFLNFFVWAKHSSSAVPFGIMISLLSLWFFVCLPLTFIGYFFGFRKQAYEHPVRTNQIPRQVPAQVWYLNTFFGVLVAGVLPFGAIFIELFFVLSAIWENHFYYLFGFLFLVFVILVLCCAQISIVMTYFQLCGEDYHWWWRCVVTSGGSAFYIAVYSIYYLVTKLEITQFVSLLLYFSYSLIMVVAVWILTGTVGFYSAYWFIRKIYGAVKID